MKQLLYIFTLLAICSGCNAKVTVKDYKVEVVKEFTHDTKAYTQGLFFHDGRFYESTGQWGESSMREVDLESGSVLRKVDFARKYFGEGSVILGDNLYVLTWTSNLVFVYDAATFEFKQAYSYPREGWGLTTDGERLIASDGSSKIYYLDDKLNFMSSINVTLDGRPIKYLNELEWIDGKIWANVYTTDYIVVINPSDGRVEARIDCTGLLPRSLFSATTDVLNGIAYEKETGRIYLTGKYWPRLYEVKLVPVKNK